MLLLPKTGKGDYNKELLDSYFQEQIADRLLQACKRKRKENTVVVYDTLGPGPLEILTITMLVSKKKVKNFRKPR